MPAAILVALGLALMVGAEAHFSTAYMIMQGAFGAFVFILGLAIGASDLDDRARTHREERNW